MKSQAYKISPVWGPVVAALCSVGSLARAATSGDAVLQAPETEFALALTELSNLQKTLQAGSELEKRTGLGPQNIAADRAFAAASEAFGRGEHLAAVRELNQYLNATQVPQIAQYLKAQYMLGRSHEQTGFAGRAIRAYLRYLATFLTHKQPDFDELLDVLRHMVPLVAKDTPSGRAELNQLLSSIMALDLPREIAPDLSFLAAKAAAGNGQTGVAVALLERSLGEEKVDPGLRARVHYFRAVIALAKNDYDGAEGNLVEAVQVDGQDAAEVRDLAHLGLARIAIHRRQPTLALKHYNAIDEVAENFRDALFESIYVHLDLKQDKEAQSKAKFFVTRYPEGPEAFQVRVLLSYLDLRSGDLSKASTGIDETNKQLDELTGWLSGQFKGREMLTQGEVALLMTRTKGLIAQPAAINEGQRQFSQLAELAARLGNARGEIRNTVFTMGRANIENLRPDWVNRAKQLTQTGEEILRIGHRLAAVERNLLAERLSPVQKQELSASESRRTRLLTEPAKIRRQMTQWASYADLTDLTSDLAKSEAKVDAAQASVAASRFHLGATKDEKKKADRLREIERQEDSLKRAREVLAKTLDLVRREKVKDLLNQSPHRALRKFMSQYALAIHDESVILAGVREKSSSPTERLLFDDAERAWNLWRHVSAEIYGQISALDKAMKEGLDGSMKEMADHEARANELNDKLTALSLSLQGQMGRSLAAISEQYRHEISTRLARHQKWSADIEWLTYTGATQREDQLRRKMDLESQILKDNLLDLQQGVLWK